MVTDLDGFKIKLNKFRKDKASYFDYMELPDSEERYLKISKAEKQWHFICYYCYAMHVGLLEQLADH